MRRGENSTRRRKIRVDQELEVRAMYESGTTQGQIAVSFGCSEAVVRRVLRRVGATTRRRGAVSPYRTDPNFVSQVLSMRSKGMSVLAISKELGVGPNPVSRALKDSGMEARGAKLDRHGMWKGGRITNAAGYIQIRIGDDHEFSCMRSVTGYVLEHRLVMATHLGRPLKSYESVHHIDGVRTNNVIDNLQLRVGSHGAHVRYRCQDCGSARIEPTEL